MKIGIFGGAFNPIHIGHLITVEEVRQRIGLDKVLFIPTYNPPHKKNLTSYKHRRNMTLLAIKDNPRFELCEIEKIKGGTSWTIETLKELHKQYPRDILFMIIGSDQYAVMDTWKEPENIHRYSNLIVMQRPGSRNAIKKLKSVQFINISQIDIASNRIRRAVNENKSIKYKVKETVLKYIEKNKLYK
jgi:nicotinate-nucleotide adenylyltransferase